VSDKKNGVQLKTGAVITAAGRSSRMGVFKPLLKIGSLTAAEHIIRNFLAASITNIAIVTGNNAEKLENSLKQRLKQPGIVFLRNDMYEHNEMLDSIRIGLAYQKEKCNKVFITPVDVPLFSSDTVKALLNCKTDVGIPTCNGRTGHPVILGNNAVTKILTYSGSGGLRNAITELSLEVEHIETEDRGMLYDIDTQEDYASILKLFAEMADRREK
jgi:CTP:molybdopterin cytidylyltransferase MocA